MVALASAFVRLRPDTAGFRQEGETKLKAVRLTAKVRLTPDVSGFATAAKTALARTNLTATVRLQAGTAGLAGSINRAITSAGGEKAAHAKGQSIGAAFSTGFGSGGSTFARVAATMASRATIAAAAIGAATPAVTQFVAALAPATGVVAGLVPALAGAGAASATFKVAVSGVSDAIGKGLYGTTKAYEKALEELAPAQRAVTQQIVALKPQIQGLRQVVSQRFFAPLVDDIRPLTRVFLPLLSAQMGRLGGELGQFGSQVLAAARQAAVIRAVKDVFTATGVSVKNLNGLVGPLIASLARLVSSSVPLLRTMSGDLAGLVTRFTAWVNSAARSGVLVTAFTNAKTVIKDLLAIMANVGAITAAVFRTATGGTNTFLTRLRQVTQQARDFVTSVQGGQQVADLFRTLGVLGEALRRALAGVLPQVGESLRIAAPAATAFAAAASRMVVSLGPLLPALTGVAVQLLTALIPAMERFTGWLSRNQNVLRQIAPYLVGYVVASKAVAVAVGVSTIATRAWSVAVGVAKVAQAGWTAVTWLAAAPVHVHTAAMRLSRSTIVTWMGVKTLEARAWLSTVAATVADTAAKVANRAATLAHAAASRVAAASSAVFTAVAGAGKWVAATAAIVANRAAIIAHAAASKVAAAATVVWTAVTNAAAVAMRLAGVALRFMMGPIGIAITAVGLLTAAVVYLWKNNETFRKIVLTVWAAVRAAISAVGEWFRNTLVPAIRTGIENLQKGFQFLWSWVQRIWGWITSFIQLQWRVVSTVFNAIRVFVTQTLPNAFRWFVDRVREAVTGWRIIISAGWDFVRGRFTAVVTFLRVTLVAGFRWFVDRVRESFTAWRTIISTGWDFVRGRFTALRDFITKTLPSAFASGVNAIGRAWDALKAKAKAPVAFVVNSVINPLIGGYNRIAKIFGAPEAKTIAGYASGGKIPGVASDRDNRFAQVVDAGRRALGNIKVATGEFIVNARSTAANLPLIQAINNAKGSVFGHHRYRGVDTARDGLEGFDEGGIVGRIGGFFKKVGNGLKGAASFVTNPAEGLRKLFASAMGAIPGSGPIITMLKGMGTKVFEGVKKFLSGAMFTGAGGDGSSFGKWPSSPAAQRGDSGVWRRIVAMIKASGIRQGVFGNGYRHRDPKWHGSGRAVDWMGYNMDALATWLSRLKPLELIHRTRNRDYAYTRGRNKGSFNESLMNAHKNHIHIAMRLGGMLGAIKDRMGNLSPVKLLDRGGRWPSGTLAANMSGHDEHVMTGGPGGDIAELKELLAAILAVLRGVGGDVASALERPTRRAVQLGRGRGPVSGSLT